MLRAKFEKEMQGLEDQIISLGSQVEENIVNGVEALIQRDLRLSQQLIVADTAVNEKRIKIGLDGLSLIARQQPMAGDMRLIAAIIEIVGRCRHTAYNSAVTNTEFQSTRRIYFPAICQSDGEWPTDIAFIDNSGIRLARSTITSEFDPCFEGVAHRVINIKLTLVNRNTHLSSGPIQ